MGIKTGDDYRKSSFSGQGGNCVAVGREADGTIKMRNSRHPNGSKLYFNEAEWDAFVAGVKAGEFDLEG